MFIENLDLMSVGGKTIIILEIEPVFSSGFFFFVLMCVAVAFLCLLRQTKKFNPKKLYECQPDTMATWNSFLNGKNMKRIFYKNEKIKGSSSFFSVS